MSMLQGKAKFEETTKLKETPCDNLLRRPGRDFLSSKYEFRSSARQALPLTTTWLDQDESGDYDPQNDIDPANVPYHRRPRLVRRAGNPNPTIIQRPRILSWGQARRYGLSYPITIRFNSPKWMRTLQHYSKLFVNNWPDQEVGNRKMSFTELKSDPLQPRRLRQRYSHHSQLEYDLPELSDIKLGHPAARGCKGCFAIGLPCSLLQEGEKYPCRVCKEDGNECELIIPPPKKSPCESCRRRKIVCSYVTEKDHSQPCRDCQISGDKCVAGPLLGRTRMGPSLDQDISYFVPTPERPYKSCTACRKAKKYCSHERNPGYDDCTRCKALEQSCTFDTLYPQSKIADAKKRWKEAEKPQYRLRDGQVIGGGTVKSIRTGLAHPIIFNHEVSEDGSDPCHWCENALYGILGLGEVRVRVLDFHDWEGYKEIGGGHIEKGNPPSRMCNKCTSSRIKVLNCSKHHITPIEGTDPETFDFSTVMYWMKNANSASIPFDWCSICPNPAFYACCAPAVASMDIKAEEAQGCGLRLCVDCASEMVHEHHGNLSEFVAALEENTDLTSYDLRADVNFLRSDGHLLDRIARGLSVGKGRHG